MACAHSSSAGRLCAPASPRTFALAIGSSRNEDHGSDACRWPAHGRETYRVVSDRPPAVGLFSVVTAALSEVRTVARAVPGVRLLEEQAAETERYVLRELKRRIDMVDDGRRAAAAAQESAVSGAAAAPPPPSPGEMLHTLLRRSMDNTPDESRKALHEHLIASLVPDEARILSALSDGSAYPLVHVAEPGVGSFQKRVLENASSVGRQAGVSLPDRTHLYVTHLRQLGLVETRDEDAALKDEYEVLLTDQLVRATIRTINKGPRGARVIRRTLVISDLGRELWEAAL